MTSRKLSRAALRMSSEFVEIADAIPPTRKYSHNGVWISWLRQDHQLGPFNYASPFPPQDGGVPPPFPEQTLRRIGRNDLVLFRTPDYHAGLDGYECFQTKPL